MKEHVAKATSYDGDVEAILLQEPPGSGQELLAPSVRLALGPGVRLILALPAALLLLRILHQHSGFPHPRGAYQPPSRADQQAEGIGQLISAGELGLHGAVNESVSEKQNRAN